jgi:hypothetical protein
MSDGPTHIPTTIGKLNKVYYKERSRAKLAVGGVSYKEYNRAEREK